MEKEVILVFRFPGIGRQMEKRTIRTAWSPSMLLHSPTAILIPYQQFITQTWRLTAFNSHRWTIDFSKSHHRNLFLITAIWFHFSLFSAFIFFWNNLISFLSKITLIMLHFERISTWWFYTIRFLLKLNIFTIYASLNYVTRNL